ncbi:MAG: nucleoside recognition domain-containing protein [Ruminococcus sp.]|jgi:spore maturation protein B|nr:nucleoside recognition domain-containing protein [Ruminococcus sp.]
MEMFIPLFTAAVVVFGLIKKVELFDAFTKGARDGIGVLVGIAPTLVGLVVAVNMLKASGAADMLCGFVSPAAQWLGFPEEIVPMIVLRPVSGGGSTALLTGIYKDCGPDSFAGLCASVLAGSTETTFYAIAVYYSAAGIKKLRHTLPAALSADFTAAVMAVVSVRMFLS